MAKMRGIKPETFTDDKILQVDPMARWLFVGMWTQACDNGHVEDNHVQLKVRLLPVDNCDVQDLIGQLVGAELVNRGDGFLKIPNLTKHQKIDKRYLVFCKWCDHDDDLTFKKDDKQARDRSKKQRAHRATDGQTANAHRVPGDEGEGEGEGEYISDHSEQPSLELVHPEPSANASDKFEEFWKAYPRRAPHSNPKKPARQKFLEITKKVDPQLLIDSVTAYAKTRENEDPRFTVQAIKWLRDERWEDDYSTQPQGDNTWNKLMNWTGQN